MRTPKAYFIAKTHKRKKGKRKFLKKVKKKHLKRRLKKIGPQAYRDKINWLTPEIFPQKRVITLQKKLYYVSYFYDLQQSAICPVFKIPKIIKKIKQKQEFPLNKRSYKLFNLLQKKSPINKKIDKENYPINKKIQKEKYLKFNRLLKKIQNQNKRYK